MPAHKGKGGSKPKKQGQAPKAPKALPKKQGQAPKAPKALPYTRAKR